MRNIYLLFCLFLFSCSHGGDMIKNTDMIEINFRDSGIIYKHQDSSRNLVKNFMKVLDGKKEQRKCSTEGEIRFYSKDSILFIGGFSISGGKDGCQFLMRGDDAWRLTYNTGMYLSETLGKIKAEK